MECKITIEDVCDGQFTADEVSTKAYLILNPPSLGDVGHAGGRRHRWR
jgi:hypothetical protein